MASHTPTNSKHFTLSASTVDTVTWGGGPPTEVEILNNGTVDVYYRLDNTDPTVAGDECYVVRAGESVTEDGSSTLKLIASASCAVSVIRNG